MRGMCKAIIEAVEPRQLLAGYLSGISARVDPLHASAVLNVQLEPGIAPAAGDRIAFYHSRPVQTTVTQHKVVILNPFGPGMTITPVDDPAMVLLTLPTSASHLVSKASLMPFADGVSIDGVPFGRSNGISMVAATWQQTLPAAPDLVRAAAAKATIGSISPNAESLTFSNIPIGMNWVWAEYLSADGAVLDTSSHIEVRGSIQPAIGIEQGPTNTVAAPPAFRATVWSGRYIYDVAPLSDDTSLLGGTGHARLQTSSPGVNVDWLPESIWGIQSVTTGIYGTGTTATGGTLHVGTIGMVGATSGYADSILTPAGMTTYLGGLTIGNGYGASTTSGTIRFGASGTWILNGGHGTVPRVGVLHGDISSLKVSDGKGGTISPVVVTLPDTDVPTWYTPPTFSGQVTFTIDGTQVGQFDLSTTDLAYQPPVDLAAGSHVLRVAFTGNEYYLNSERTITFEVTPTPVTVTLAAADTQIHQGEQALLDVGVSLRARGSATLSAPVAIYCDNALLTEVTLSGSTSTISVNLPVGTHQLKAVYLGNGGRGESDAITLTVLGATPPVAALALNGRTLTGWAVNPREPGATVTTTISLDGRVIGTVQANRMTSRNVGKGRHGLLYTLPKLTAGNHRLVISTRDAATGQEFALGAFGIAVRQLPRRTFGAIAKITGMSLASANLEPWPGPGTQYLGQTNANGYAYYLDATPSVIG